MTDYTSPGSHLESGLEATVSNDLVDLQQQSEKWDEQVENQPVILVTLSGQKHQINLPVDVIRGLLNPHISDFFIEIAPPTNGARIKHHYLHTGVIAEVLLLFDIDK